MDKLQTYYMHYQWVFEDCKASYVEVIATKLLEPKELKRAVIAAQGG